MRLQWRRRLWLWQQQQQTVVDRSSVIFVVVRIGAEARVEYVSVAPVARKWIECCAESRLLDARPARLSRISPLSVSAAALVSGSAVLVRDAHRASLCKFWGKRGSGFHSIHSFPSLRMLPAQAHCTLEPKGGCRASWLSDDDAFTAKLVSLSSAGDDDDDAEFRVQSVSFKFTVN